MVMMTEGVHEGSEGPLYYPSEELALVPYAWNHRPIVMYHPEINGQAVSACDPIIINARKVGLVLGARWDKEMSKLRAEAWLEVARVNNIDSRVIQMIRNGQKVELSTGLITDKIPTEGEWNGKKYRAIARNYRPDHLALLPDKVGACSIADGAGLNVTNEDKKMNREQRVAALITANVGWTEAEKGFLTTIPDGQFDVIEKTANTIITANKEKADREAKEKAEADRIAKEKADKDAKDRQTNNTPAPAPTTMEAYLASAPPEFREVLVNGLNAHNAEKARLITIITANAQNKFTKEYLDKLSLDVLTGIAALAVQPVQQTPVLVNGQQVATPIYTGATGAAPTQNEQKQQGLALPAVDWSKK